MILWLDLTLQALGVGYLTPLEFAQGLSDSLLFNIHLKSNPANLKESTSYLMIASVKEKCYIYIETKFHCLFYFVLKSISNFSSTLSISDWNFI